MSKYSEEELAGLTEEERAALTAEDDEPEEEQEDDDPVVEAPEENEPEPTEEPTEPEAEAEPEPAAATGELPVYTAEKPADIENKVAEIVAAKEALSTRFDDGDITAKEYQKELDALNKQEREIEREVFKAQLADEMRQQQERNEWARDVKNFLAEHDEYSKSKVLYSTLDTLVKEIAQNPDNAGLTGPEILAAAHKQVQEALGIFGVKPDQTPPAVQKGKKKPDIPPTLAKLPAAESTDTAGGKFAVLDRLADTDPLRFEKELAKLSESDRERYLEQA
jgi:hypothetical protein